MATLSREKVIKNWSTVVENGAGKAQWVLDTTEKYIKDLNMPGVNARQEGVSTGLFGEKRNFLIVTHKNLREYGMFIGAREFGRHIDVAWFVTVHPGFLKRAVSKHIAAGNPNALSMNIDLFAQQDLRAFVTSADMCLQQTLQLLLEEIKPDYPAGTRRDTSFLQTW